MVNPAQGLVMVPLLLGGAPYWEPAIRGAILATRNSAPVGARGLEWYVIKPRFAGAMLADFKIRPDQLALRVDGGGKDPTDHAISCRYPELPCRSSHHH